MMCGIIVTVMMSFTACSDDYDEPTPNSNDGEVGQTVKVNDKTWYVSNQSYMKVFQWGLTTSDSSSLGIFLANKKVGESGYVSLSFALNEVFLPEYYSIGEALNTALSSGTIGIDNVTSYELTYKFGKVIYQGYDATEGLISLELDNYTLSYSNSEEIVIDGIVKIKYVISGYTDTISVNNKTWYVSLPQVIDSSYNDTYYLGLRFFNWNRAEYSEITLQWWDIVGHFTPDDMHIDDVIDVRSSSLYSHECTEKGSSGNLTLESGTITYQGYDSNAGIILLKLNDLTFISDDNQTLVLNGTIKMEDKNVLK